MNLSSFSVSDALSNIQSSDIFLKSLDIDIANNSQRPLFEALAEKQVNREKAVSVLNLLHDLPSEDAHWVLEPTSHLIDYIKNNYHAHHRLQLPGLIALAQAVETANTDHPLCPLGLANLLRELNQDLLVHMEKEEEMLFQFLLEQHHPNIFSQVSLAMHNHDHDLHLLRRIDELTNNLSLPGAADTSWTSLYHELKQFRHELEEHIRLENDVLFEICS